MTLEKGKLNNQSCKRIHLTVLCPIMFSSHRRRRSRVRAKSGQSTSHYHSIFLHKEHPEASSHPITVQELFVQDWPGSLQVLVLFYCPVSGLTARSPSDEFPGVYVRPRVMCSTSKNGKIQAHFLLTQPAVIQPLTILGVPSTTAM